jgi:hypothetical protein
VKGVRGLPRDRKTLGGEGASATVLRHGAVPGAHRRAPAQNTVGSISHSGRDEPRGLLAPSPASVPQADGPV